ncbi:MAG: DUF3179 domain-containing protein [Candidatus Poribacteria bacterium]|nr:DUF3179 domain-containing protein [Candidatus Poribacteria bacterium]
MKGCFMVLCIFAVIVVVGCADNPTSETETDEVPSDATFMRTPTQVTGEPQQIAMAPQQAVEEKPSQRLLSFFPEFFPDNVEHSIPLDKIFHGGPPKDGIPALTNPKAIPAQVADYLQDTDLVLGITVNGESRAYPWRILNWHEIVNDTLGGKPVLVTLCPLCGTGIAFDPVVDGEVVEFGVSGMLYNSDLLMYDRGTDTPSLWAQALGEAVVGPRTGTQLDLLPITQALWGEWRAAHPDTTVLSTATGFDRNYSRNIIYPDGFIVGQLSVDIDPRLPNTAKVLGVRLDDAKKAYVIEDLREKQVLNDTVAGVPIVLIASPISDSVRVYERKNRQFGGGFEKVVEIGTNDVWEFSEEFLSNPETGDSLQRIPDVFVSFWFAWFAFHPDTLVYEETFTVSPEVRLFTTWGEIKR